MSDGVLECGSRTTSKSLMMLGPPHRFWRILISLQSKGTHIETHTYERNEKTQQTSEHTLKCNSPTNQATVSPLDLLLLDGLEDLDDTAVAATKKNLDVAAKKVERHVKRKAKRKINTQKKRMKTIKANQKAKNQARKVHEKSAPQAIHEHSYARI